MNVVIVMECQPELFQIIFTLAAAGGFPGLLDCGQQQRNQYGNNRDHHQEFDQREP